MSVKSRNFPLDLARSLCVIYIIGIWHFNGYLHESLHFSETSLDFLRKVTYMVLATFTFLSGYFCGKYEFKSLNDIKIFAAKRFKRFFLLLLLSSLIFYAFRWINFVQLIQIVTGTNLFSSKSVPTLWFFSMIIFFYAITPLLNFKQRSSIPNLLLALFIMAVLCCLSINHYIDKRLCMYFPFYVGGTFCNNNKVMNLDIVNISKLSLEILGAFISIVLILFIVYTNSFFCDYCIMFLGTAFIMILSYIVYNKRADPIIAFFAESSMVAYLFHRQIFGIFKLLSGILFSHHWLNVWFALLALTATFVISYYFQMAYNYLIDKIYAK